MEENPFLNADIDPQTVTGEPITQEQPSASESVIPMWSWIKFAMVGFALMLFYIYNSHHANKAIRKKELLIKELKELLINSAGSNVVHKAVEIAMNDEHPAQMAAIKLCMDRMLPVSLFEKEGKQRSAVTINITGIGEISHAPVIDLEDIEDKNV